MYPPKLTVGPPKRHHIVVYFHAKLRSEFTAAAMEERTQLDANEVKSAAWLSKDVISAIAESYEENQTIQVNSVHLPKTIRSVILDSIYLFLIIILFLVKGGSAWY